MRERGISCLEERKNKLRATSDDAAVIIDVGVAAREKYELKNRKIEREIQ
jgi:hypothetical protein